MKHYLLLLLSLWLCAPLCAQTRLVVKVPANTPPTDTLYVVGPFTGYNAADSAWRLTKTSKGHYTITLPTTAEQPLLYRITRGGWNRAEGDRNGKGMPMRVLPLKTIYTEQIEVAGWVDMPRKFPETLSRQVVQPDTVFTIPGLNRQRRIQVYLPKGYQARKNKQRYPVLYMLDGQNVFDYKRSFAGEWQVDEALDAAQGWPWAACIVVAVDNNSEHRMAEYAPWPHDRFTESEGDATMRFLVDVVKPYVDASYRTLADRNHTGIMGSSLGGLMSFYAVLTYPEVFSKAGLFSPSFWFGQDKAEELLSSFNKQHQFKIYLLMGELEGPMMVEPYQVLLERFQEAGFGTDELVSEVDYLGQHHESFWARRFADAMRWLYQ